MRPSHPVRHFCPRLNQRCLCSLRRSSLRVLLFGIETYFTPSACAGASFAWEQKPASLIRKPFLEHLVMGNDLILRFLPPAKLVGLARIPLANDFRVRLKQVDQLVRKRW